VEALRRGDPDAADQLVARYGDRVYRLAVRITGMSQDAEEAAQDALLTAARGIHMFKGESAFGSWIDPITAAAAYQKLRTRRLHLAKILGATAWAWSSNEPVHDQDATKA